MKWTLRGRQAVAYAKRTGRTKDLRNEPIPLHPSAKVARRKEVAEKGVHHRGKRRGDGRRRHLFQLPGHPHNGQDPMIGTGRAPRKPKVRRNPWNARENARRIRQGRAVK